MIQFIYDPILGLSSWVFVEPEFKDSEITFREDYWMEIDDEQIENVE